MLFSIRSPAELSELSVWRIKHLGPVRTSATSDYRRSSRSISFDFETAYRIASRAYNTSLNCHMSNNRKINASNIDKYRMINISHIRFVNVMFKYYFILCIIRTIITSFTYQTAQILVDNKESFLVCRVKDQYRFNNFSIPMRTFEFSIE